MKLDKILSLSLGVFCLFGLLAPAIVLAINVDASATVGNANPVVYGLAVNDENTAGGVQVYPTANATKQVSANFSVFDANGFADVTTLEYNVNGSGYNSITIVTYCSGVGQVLTCLDAPVGTQNFYTPVQNFLVGIKATDSQAGTGTNTTGGLYSYEQLISLAPYTTVAYGSGNVGQTKTVDQDWFNTGNVILDADVTGANLVKSGDTILVGNASLNGTALTLAPQAFNLNIVTGASSSGAVRYALVIPNVPAGAYAGTYVVTGTESV